jgi:hypothetical protein
MIDADKIVSDCAEKHGVSIMQVRSRQCGKTFDVVRQECVELLWNSGMELKEIAAVLNRSHTMISQRVGHMNIRYCDLQDCGCSRKHLI